MSFDKIIYRLTDKRIPAATGIGLVGEILERAGFQEQFRNVRSENKRSRKQIDCGTIMTTFIGLLCMSKPDFDAIAEFQNDAAYYQTALHLTKGFPSSATLRQRMDEIGKTQREEINVGILLENGAYYVIKRNLRKEDRNEWAENIRSWCKDIREPREGKKVYVGSTFKDLFYATEDGEQKSICNRIVYEMIERDSSPDGQFFLEPEIELNMFWTNLGESDQEIIDLYHAHGECEQFHSEIKTDMDVERLPSGKFDTNELVLELTMIAYNILRMLGQETVLQGKAPSKRIVARKRIRTVIQNIIHFAGQLSRHARQLFLSISRSNAWANTFLGLVQRFVAC